MGDKINREENNRVKPESMYTFHWKIKMIIQLIWFDIKWNEVTSYGMIKCGRKEINQIWWFDMTSAMWMKIYKVAYLLSSYLILLISFLKCKRRTWTLIPPYDSIHLPLTHFLTHTPFSIIHINVSYECAYACTYAW